MLAFKIRLNGNDQEQRFASKEEAHMLADVFADDFPEATIEIVEIEQFTSDSGIDGQVVEVEQ